ncbi:CO059 protein, partial [Penelope pileata]|nr:CO059 protein [Penelope pileata]
MDSRSCRDRQPSDPPSSSSSNCSSGKSEGERERIRSRMKMVIGQLEGILQELKEVAKELREVVSQIDRLTSDFDFELEADDWTTATASSTSSSEKGGVSFELGPLDFAAADILSDSWEFCSFLETSTPSDHGDGPEPPRPQPARSQPDYRLMNGGVPIANGPRGGTPDSSSEEAFAPQHKAPPHRTAGMRERVRFSDKVLYHALCCDDDGDGADQASPNEDSAEELGRKVTPKHPPTARGNGGGTAIGPPARRLTRNSSTQTVADKSTQTVLPYIPAKQKIKMKN